MTLGEETLAALSLPSWKLQIRRSSHHSKTPSQVSRSSLSIKKPYLSAHTLLHLLSSQLSPYYCFIDSSFARTHAFYANKHIHPGPVRSGPVQRQSYTEEPPISSSRALKRKTPRYARTLNLLFVSDPYQVTHPCMKIDSKGTSVAVNETGNPMEPRSALSTKE
jgi:hypothetical protein